MNPVGFLIELVVNGLRLIRNGLARLLPAPDVVVLEVRGALPELPEARRRRFVAAYGLPEYDAGVLTQSAELASYFEQVVADGGNPKAASNWVMGELLRTLKERGASTSDVPLSPRALAGLIRLVDRGAISSSIAKDVFAKMYDSGRSAEDIVATDGLAQIDDEAALLALVRDVMTRHGDVVVQYRAGKNATFGFLVGQVMKGSGGKANPKLTSQLLKRELDK